MNIKHWGISILSWPIKPTIVLSILNLSQVMPYYLCQPLLRFLNLLVAVWLMVLPRAKSISWQRFLSLLWMLMQHRAELTSPHASLRAKALLSPWEYSACNHDFLNFHAGCGCPEQLSFPKKGERKGLEKQVCISGKWGRPLFCCLLLLGHSLQALAVLDLFEGKWCHILSPYDRSWF